LAAVILIVPIAGYFVFETIEANNATIEANNATIRRNNIIAGLQVPACYEVFEAPLSGDRRVTTCYIERANCNRIWCQDALEEGPHFILHTTRNFDLLDFAGECLLVTGEVGMFNSRFAILANDQSDIEICQ